MGFGRQAKIFSKLADLPFEDDRNHIVHTEVWPMSRHDVICGAFGNVSVKIDELVLILSMLGLTIGLSLMNVLGRVDDQLPQ